MFRLMWGLFGIKPNILDESQVKVTVRDCINEFVKQFKAAHPGEDGTVTKEQELIMAGDLEAYTRWVIEQYILNFKFPRF